MLSLCRTTLSSLYLFCPFVLALNLFVLSANAVDESIPLQEQTAIFGTASEETFSFEDIYRIALNSDVSVNIEMIATEDSTIRVTLEKQIQPTDTADDARIRAYLDNISLTGTQNDGTLQLNAQVPGGSATETKPNPFFKMTELQAKLRKQLQLKWIIKTPADISVKFSVKNGDIRLKRIRGKIEIATETGNVQLDETLGNYNVSIKKGRVYGTILLTHGQNKLETQDGSIELVMLDTVAAPMDITAQGGNIRLKLPEDYAVDVELESEKQQIVINLPAQFDNEASLTIINDGGPLFRLKATDTISILPSSTDIEDTPSDTEVNIFANAILPVPKATQSPVIDGNLSEIVWQTAQALSPFQNPDGTEEAVDSTETFLLWDSENFYIGVKAYISGSQFPHLSQTQHDSPIWEDECIEILVDSDLQTDSYYHLVINPIGALFDQQVNVPGAPSFRLAPHDVQLTLDRKTMQTSFAADSKWNSEAKVAAQINTTFWSIEVALPRKMLEKPSKSDAQPASVAEDGWLFNIHRKAYSSVGSTENLGASTHREYSYWLPTYNNEHPWWFHSPHEYMGVLSERYAPAMGVLNLVTGASTDSEAFTSEEKFQVTAVEIEDNTTIPTAVIQQNIPIQPGDVITVSQLSWLIAELRAYDLFQDVRLETRQGQLESGDPLFPTVSVHIRVVEVPVVLVRQIKINGNRSFPSQFIKDWFQLKPGYLAVAATKLKQQLIANFYANRGYAFAIVNYRMVDGVLEFSINEGTLHEIRFTGNTRISRGELLSALDLKTGNSLGGVSSQTSDIYHHTLGQSKINRMRRELRANSAHFKSIRDWRVQREGGKNVMVVEIEEQPFAKPGGFPIIQFNRVHGLMLGAGGTLATQLTGREQVFGSISHGFSSKIWNYHAGVGKSFFRRQLLKIGGSFYKLTDVSSNTYLHQGDASLSAAYYGFDIQDYYERWGSQGWITYAPTEWSYLRLELTGENHGNLSKSTDWSYLNRNQFKRGNSRIDRGRLRNLALVFTFDTRDHRSAALQDFHKLFVANERTRRGWRAQFAFEMTGQYFGGDYDFNFYRFEVARYTPLSGPHHLNIRVTGDFSDAQLPRQRLLHLGGGSTLRGHDFNRFAGDNRFLINLEYRFIRETIRKDPDAVIGWSLSCFLDTGSVWWHGETPFPNFETFSERLKTSVGIGCSVFIDPSGTRTPWSLAIEVAEPLDSSFSLRNPKLISRFSRIF